MNLDVREVLVCFVTILLVAAATLIAVGAVATYSIVVHGRPGATAALAVPVDDSSMIEIGGCPLEPDLPTYAVVPSETGLPCPISHAAIS